jgi:predicted nucleic acid-binding protein
MKGRLVSNAGPIIALNAIDHLEILKSIFTEIIVPEPVHNNEIMQGGKDFTGLASYRKATWIKVVPLAEPIEPLIGTLLDKGEASVIQLAREKGVDFVLIDERKARKIARKIYGIHVIGSARIIVEAKHRGLISNVREALEGMRSAGYWIHDDIMKKALEQAEEG